jgi:hypothetical protein
MSINRTGYLEVVPDCVKLTSCCLYAEKALCLGIAVPFSVPLLFRCTDALYFTNLFTCFFCVLLFGCFFDCSVIVYHVNIIQRRMRRDGDYSQLKKIVWGRSSDLFRVFFLEFIRRESDDGGESSKAAGAVIRIRTGHDLLSFACYFIM